MIQWQTAKFGSNASNPLIAGDLADPDGDGICNLLEYAFGSTPLLVSSSQSLPTSSLVVSPLDGSQHLQLVVNLFAPATDITITPEVSGDLKTWFSGSTAVEIISDTTLNQVRTLVVRDKTPSVAVKRYFRVTVFRP